MSRHAQSFRQHARISELCPIFDATLSLVSEEGIPLHQVHQRPLQVVVGPDGRLGPLVDRHIAVILGVNRTSELLPHMESDLQILEANPLETLFLELPVGTTTLRTRARLAKEASDIFVEVAEAKRTVKIAAISHRRQICGVLVLRHYPVALFDEYGALLWLHPAGPAYGLIRDRYPQAQKRRTLGPVNLVDSPDGLQRRLDDASGLPALYRYAFKRMRAANLSERLGFAEVMEYQAEIWMSLGLGRDLETALRELTQDYLVGFETFFGAGGLRPVRSVSPFV